MSQVVDIAESVEIKTLQKPSRPENLKTKRLRRT